jgi:cell division protein FtsL
MTNGHTVNGKGVTALWITIIIMILVSATSITMNFASSNVRDNLQECKENIQENTKGLAQMETNYRVLERDIDHILEKLEDQDVKLSEIYNMIRDGK